MKKNISLAHALLLLPLFPVTSVLGMEIVENNKNNLDESVMVTIVPTERGLGIVRSSFDFIWNEEDNLYHDLKSKKFNPQNSSYHHKLDTALQIYVSKGNSERISEILKMCREDYPKQTKVGDGQACMIHQFLVKKNKDKQTELAKTIKTKDQEFITKTNNMLAALKESLDAKIIAMRFLRNTYLGINEQKGERNILVEQEGNEIRKLKSALINTHKLNKAFVLPQDADNGYCSDNEKDIKNPDNINNSYNDEHILQKINIADKMKQTTDKINDLLYHLTELQTQLNNIQDLEY